MEYSVFDLLTLLGSLGFFLYGMKVMSDALLKIAGSKMRNILAASTSNRFRALLTGLLSTAALQSSSATTLMAVSFVNARLLTLTEAVGIIMGANIGTTVTAWIISILGFKVNMSALAVPLVGAGFLPTFSKTEKYTYAGQFLIGFGLLFIGLQFLKDSLPDIANNPEILAFLQHYTQMGYASVMLFLMIGTGLTLLVQSSSATMALTLLMTHQGWIPFDMAAAMVLGENIGTTITANLAAVISNYHAKRAARAHLLFNLLGVLWILLILYPFLDGVALLITRIAGKSPMTATETVPVALSLFHTSFNILNALFLIGFLPMLVKLAERLVPEERETTAPIECPKYLDEKNLEYAETAIKALFDESLRLLQNTAYMVIVNGLNVHRKDLESTRRLKEIINNSEKININFRQIYTNQVKTIYGAILNYATRLQSAFDLSERQIETIRNILIADRKVVSVVKNIKRLRSNIDHYDKTDNKAIRREYNLLKRRILKVAQFIHILNTMDVDGRKEILHRLHKQRHKAKKLDVLRNGRINDLLVSGEIDDHMATSLINDSLEAMHMAQMLVDIVLLLYVPVDETDSVAAEDIHETGTE